MLGDSLILMGEIGGNDFFYPSSEGKSINETKLQDLIIKAISSAIVVTNLYTNIITYLFYTLTN